MSGMRRGRAKRQRAMGVREEGEALEEAEEQGPPPCTAPHPARGVQQTAPQVQVPLEETAVPVATMCSTCRVTPGRTQCEGLCGQCWRVQVVRANRAARRTREEMPQHLARLVEGGEQMNGSTQLAPNEPARLGAECSEAARAPAASFGVEALSALQIEPALTEALTASALASASVHGLPDARGGEGGPGEDRGDGLRGVELRSALLGLLREACLNAGAEGVALRAIVNAQLATQEAVRNTLCELVDAGDIYTTIDDEHFFALSPLTRWIGRLAPNEPARLGAERSDTANASAAFLGVEVLSDPQIEPAFSEALPAPALAGANAHGPPEACGGEGGRGEGRGDRLRGVNLRTMDRASFVRWMWTQQLGERGAGMLNFVEGAALPPLRLRPWGAQSWSLPPGAVRGLRPHRGEQQRTAGLEGHSGGGSEPVQVGF